MTESDPVLCPECGWTGEPETLERTGTELQCPICLNAVEFVD